MKLTALRANNPVAMMAAYGVTAAARGTAAWDGTHPELDWKGDAAAHLASLLPARMQAPENALLPTRGTSTSAASRATGGWRGTCRQSG